MDDSATVEQPGEARAAAPRLTVYRHRLPTRIWHWLNAITVIVMLMSGLMIFNAHPHLYWGQFGANFDRPWLSFQGRPFPGWVTIPSTYDLAAARRWHLAFAWLLVAGLIVFSLVSLWNRHLQKDLAPTRAQIGPRHIWQDIKQHARLRLPAGEAALGYNILQKISYLCVIFVLLPLMVLTGLAMSPAMDAAWPWLLDLFGGRQSARSIHFLFAAAIALFILVHLAMVALAGPINEIGSMVTGRFRVPPERKPE